MVAELNKVNRAGIVETAWTLWDMFMVEVAGKYDNTSLFKKDVNLLPHRNPCAEAFMYFCAEVGPRAEGIITQSDLRRVYPNRLNRAASWLVAHGKKGLNKDSPILVIDLDYLKEEIPKSEAPLVLHRVYTRLLLHEVGHMVLHWKSRIEELRAAEVPSHLEGLDVTWSLSSPRQEAEAWLFCFAVLGAAIGRYSFDARSKLGGDNDPAWKILAQLNPDSFPPS